jgi:hypothetical protein
VAVSKAEAISTPAQLAKDLSCNCPAAQQAAQAVAQAIAAAGGDCGSPAGKALAGACVFGARGWSPVTPTHVQRLLTLPSSAVHTRPAHTEAVASASGSQAAAIAQALASSDAAMHCLKA